MIQESLRENENGKERENERGKLESKREKWKKARERDGKMGENKGKGVPLKLGDGYIGRGVVHFGCSPVDSYCWKRKR